MPTIDTSVVWLHMRLLNLAIVDEQSVALRSRLPEYGSSIEGEVKLGGEVSAGVTQEADLT